MTKSLHLIITLVFAFTRIDDTVSQFPPIIDIHVDNNTNPNDVGFYLCPNPKDVNDVDELVYLKPRSIRRSRYNKANPVILMSHGFTQTNLSQFPYYVKKAYLDAGYATKANIIAVDWGKLSGRYNVTGIISREELAELPAFKQAVKNVPVVGKRIQEFLVFLIQNGFLSGPEKIHLVGQSLGAHVSGMAGYYFKQNTTTSIARITGTDPASPLFQSKPPDVRLDPTDATFVDVVHTNEGVLGYDGSLGHVDFIVNKGPIQPPCKANATDLFCSHNLAPRYFGQSIPDNYTGQARSCAVELLGLCLPNAFQPSMITFGEHCPTTARGTYQINMDLDE